MRQWIGSAYAGLLSIGILGTNFSETRIWIISFLFKKMYLNMSSAKMEAILSRRIWVKSISWIVLTDMGSASSTAALKSDMATNVWRRKNSQDITELGSLHCSHFNLNSHSGKLLCDVLSTLTCRKWFLSCAYSPNNNRCYINKHRGLYLCEGRYSR